MKPRTLPLTLMTTFTMAHAEWEPLPPMPEPAGGGVAACIQGKIIYAGGTNWPDGAKHWLDTIWSFDPKSMQWSVGPKLPHPLAYAAFAGDGKRLHFAGGADGKQGRREIYVLDADLKLRHLADLPAPVVFAGGALHQGNLAVFGGTPDPDDFLKAHSDLFEVDLTNNKVTTSTPIPSMEGGISLPSIVSSGERLLSFTGMWFDAQKQVHNRADAFISDPHAATWKALPAYPIAARGVVAVMLDADHIYLAGGYGTEEQGFLATAYLFDVKAQSYTPAKPLPFAATTTLITCGEYVYVLGGENLKKHRSAACYRIRTKELMSMK